MTRTLRISVLAIALMGAAGFASAQQVKDQGGGSPKTGGAGLSDNPLKPELKSDQNAADEAKPPVEKEKSRKDAIKAN